jgi:hypothetical protein
MLLEKTRFDENDVVTIKLMSGEEVIGKFVSDDEKHFILDRPLMLAMSQKGIGMAPILVTVNPETKLRFNKNAVIVAAHSDDEIAKQYIYQTTGIQPVTNGGIVL